MEDTQNETMAGLSSNRLVCDHEEILDAELGAICDRQTYHRDATLEDDAEVKSDHIADKEELRGKLVGLALSGGGIRSAIFSLGVMQRLARAGHLERVDYLSTVSGGGYIGGSLTWLLSDAARAKRQDPSFGTTKDTFPYGVDDPRCRPSRESESGVLKHLRLNGNYLTPGRGITKVSLGAVILRGLLLNLLIWLPLFAVVMYLLLSVPPFNGNMPSFALDGAFGISLLLAAGMGIVFLLASIAYSLTTFNGAPKNDAQQQSSDDSYRGRRRFEKWIQVPLCLGAFFLAVGSLPAVEVWLEAYIAKSGAASLVLGVVGGLVSFRCSGSNGKPRIPLGVIVSVASMLLLYGLAMASYEVASYIREYDDPVLTGWLWLAVAVSVLTGWSVNLNYISIHRYYRDRLMEAFMPDPNAGGSIAIETDANTANLSDMCSKRAPYHLVNSNVILVNSSNRASRVRGGDAFLLSPKYCGSMATGWTPTACYMKEDPLTLPTAVAISGAAANPNTGFGGTGPTRNATLSLLMSLLNIRLGYWVPRPGRRRTVANHFRAAYHKLSPRGYSEDRRLLQLSDGGHFENLGVYELVRRKVKLIICCDGSADPEFRFASLQLLVRRIGADFGARIAFDRCNYLERMIPRDPDPQRVAASDHGTDAYPVDAKFAEQGYVRGTIIFPCGTESTLVLIKPTMIEGLGLLLKGYKRANPAFPDQSTADQFFDEDQFEAYRELGYAIANRLVEDTDLNLDGLLDDCRVCSNPLAS